MPSGPGLGPLQATITGKRSGHFFYNHRQWIRHSAAGSSDCEATVERRPSYLAIQNETQGWQAGNALNSDFVNLNFASWSDTQIVISGFNFYTGNLVMHPNDQLSYWVCNPASGNCGFGTITLVESGLAQLKVFVNNTPFVTLTYDLLVDGTKVPGPPLANGASTGWIPFNGSPTVTVTENATTGPAFFTPTFIDGCNSNGRIALKPGDNQTCRILNRASTGCASGQHCCSNPTSSQGCAPGCIADTIACEPLYPTGKNKCCGSPLPSGKCDNACVELPFSLMSMKWVRTTQQVVTSEMAKACTRNLASRARLIPRL